MSADPLHLTHFLHICHRLLRTEEAAQYSSLIARNLARAAQQALAVAQDDSAGASVLCGHVVRAYLQSPLKQDAPQARFLGHSWCSTLHERHCVAFKVRVEMLQRVTTSSWPI